MSGTNKRLGLLLEGEIPPDPPAPELTPEERVLAVKAFLKTKEGQTAIRQAIAEEVQRRMTPPSGTPRDAVFIPRESLGSLERASRLTRPPEMEVLIDRSANTVAQDRELARSRAAQAREVAQDIRGMEVPRSDADHYREMRERVRNPYRELRRGTTPPPRDDIDIDLDENPSSTIDLVLRDL